MSKIDPTNVSTAYLAEVFGMTRDGVTRLCRNGIISQNGVARGKYDLHEALAAYLEHLRKANRETADVKLKRQQERKLRLQNDKTEDRLVKVVDAAEVFGIYTREFRAEVEGRIAGMAAKISKTDNPRTVAKILQTEFSAIGQAANDWLLEVEGYECNS